MSEPPSRERADVPADGSDEEQQERLRRRLRRIAHLMDSSIRVPGTRYRVGLDALIGLIPGVGDAAGLAVSAYVVLAARRLGVPRRTLARMAANVGVDALVGSITVLGAVFDLGFKANRRNLRLAGIEPIAEESR